MPRDDLNQYERKELIALVHALTRQNKILVTQLEALRQSYREKVNTINNMSG